MTLMFMKASVSLFADFQHKQWSQTLRQVPEAPETTALSWELFIGTYFSWKMTL